MDGLVCDDTTRGIAWACVHGLAPDFLEMRVCLVASSLPKVSSSPSAPMDRHQELSNRVRSVPGYLYLFKVNLQAHAQALAKVLYTL